MDITLIVVIIAGSSLFGLFVVMPFVYFRTEWKRYEKQANIDYTSSLEFFETGDTESEERYSKLATEQTARAHKEKKYLAIYYGGGTILLLAVAELGDILCNIGVHGYC
jgi:hypothetical protein